jgi:CheY-like chemotaxis protein
MATILVVDDAPTNREFLVTLLGYRGHRLLEAADGAEALALVRAERPDLVIADILMPTMDGYEFVRQLRADPVIAQILVIFYTAYYHEQEAKALAQACGVAHILTKPSEPETERKQAEAQIREYATRLQVLAEASRAFAEASLDYQTLLARVARKVAAALGDNCTIRDRPLGRWA